MEYSHQFDAYNLPFGAKLKSRCVQSLIVVVQLLLKILECTQTMSDEVYSEHLFIQFIASDCESDHLLIAFINSISVRLAPFPFPHGNSISNK